MDFTTIRQSLEARGYTVSCFDTAKEAADYLDTQLDSTTIGFGGSVTLREMGLYERLSAHNHVSWHWQIPDGSTGMAVRAEAAEAEFYLTSANGLAETGEIINIDGNCNRIAAMVYGHKKVFLVAGENKIEPDYDSALHRARNVAAPLNAQRLGSKTPCAAKADRCYDCKSPARICKALSVLWEKPMSCAFEVILIHEPLGY